ncbi:MAG: hypothetical protein ACI9R3_002586 [Verrucomicrobiales bacterium]|jgi:hypothetical protein
MTDTKKKVIFIAALFVVIVGVMLILRWSNDPPTEQAGQPSISASSEEVSGSAAEKVVTGLQEQEEVAQPPTEEDLWKFQDDEKNARTFTKSLRNSVRGLLLNLPSSALSLENQSVDFTRTTDQSFMDILRGKDLERNPRGIEFGEWPDGALVDPWGNPFTIIIDGNDDGAIADPVDGNKTLKKTIFVYSAGSDGDFTTWDDNVISSL